MHMNRSGIARAPTLCVLAVLVTVVASGCSGARVSAIDNAAAEGRTDELVQRVADKLNAALPRTYDNGIVWNSARRNGLEIENRLVLPANADTRGKEAEVTRILKDKMRNSLCGRADVRRLMYHGMTLRLIVNDYRGRTFANTRISQADC